MLPFTARSKFVARLHITVVLSVMIACPSLVDCTAASAAQTTPSPDVALLLRRQALADTCGYVGANILESQGCQEGYTCFAEPSFRAAGGCCRLGDSANCQLATSCVPQASLVQSCDSDCSSNGRITKCTDSATPYCYTNYWPTGGQTLLNIGCTTLQGQFSFIYTTYTLYGSGFSDLVTATNAQNSPIPTFTISDTSAVVLETAATASNDGTAAGSAESSSDSAGSSENTVNSNNGISTDDQGGSSTNVGAIAGGTIGGVAVLGLIAALITWIILRNRREVRAAARATGGDGSGRVNARGAGESELKPPTDRVGPVSPVSPASSYVPVRKPVGSEVHGGGSRYEVPGHAEAQELGHQQRRVPELP